MKYLYPFARLPDDSDLKEVINQAAGRLDQKLCKLDLQSLGLSQYMQRYLGDYQDNLRGILQISTYLLIWSLSGIEKSFKELTFIDYGGGPGILTLLAKEVGIGRVIYNDIYDVSCRDAKRVGEDLGEPADGYVYGDLEAVKNYVEAHSFMVDIIASYDVIEHIYDTEGYFRSLHSLPHQRLRAVFASSANLHNPIIRRNRERGHLIAEYKDRQSLWGHKERDSLESFYKIRKKIIKAYASHLNEDQIDMLSRITRGLRIEDIQKCVEEYLTTGRISYQPVHLTNTCDPFTGNWQERLMDTSWIKNILVGEGFNVEVKSGYYAFTPEVIKNGIKSALNFWVALLGAHTLILSPYYLIYANLSKSFP